MKVKTVKIDDIKPYPNNPRQNDGEAIDQVADSIKTFGWQQPIVVDKDMVIMDINLWVSIRQSIYEHII